jgi:hypoxanthine phosphoribosyltransferase
MSEAMARVEEHLVDVLLPAEQVSARVAALGAAITRDYERRPLKLVGVLKGSFMFMADLARAIDLPIKLDFIGTTSYQGTATSGVVRITSDLSRPIEGEHVLLVEDIVDTGLTMRYLLENLAIRNPASLQVCALLHKPSRCRIEVPIAYRGFEIPDHFVVGYGLDWEGRYRNLPYIGTLRRP